MKKGLGFGNNDLYFIGLCLIAAGLPLSKIGISSGVILLAVSWLLGGKIISRFRNFFRNKTALVISSLFLLHLLGLLYTSDFDYAMKDLRIKLPLLVLPLIISTSEPLGNKKFRILLLIAILAVFASTAYIMYNYFTMQFSDIRDICIFVSHIRLSLFICFSIFVLYYYITKENDFSLRTKLIFGFLILWFLMFLVIIESFTGLSIMLISSFFILLRKVFKTKKIAVKIASLLVIIAVPVLLFIYINEIYKDYFNYPVDKKGNIEKCTLKGNKYSNDTISNDVENGHYVWIYICEDELRECWNKKSAYDFEGSDEKGQSIKYTLIRFLTSKGLRKDSAGISKLSDDEVTAIENGIADVNLMQLYSMKARLYETLWEFKNYQETKDPNGHSLMLRFEYWKASLEIIKKNFLIGVGTGDMNIAFARQYEEMNSRLDKQWRLRSHNQFLSITVGFGMIGLLWFLLVLVYPLFFRKYRTDFIYMVFLLIMVISMFTEDTIETQAGLTFFVFYSALLLLGRSQDVLKPEEDSQGLGN